MARLSLFLGATIRACRGAAGAGALAFGLSALAAGLAGGTRAGLEALGRQVATWRAELRIVLVLADGAGRPAERRRLATALEALPGVAAVRFVSPDEALAALAGYLGPAAGGLDRLPANPLPARFELTPSPTLDAARLDELAGALRRLPGVEAVEAPTGWVAAIERVERGLGRVGLALAGALGLAASLALGATAAAAARCRADEVAVLRLVGAPGLLVWGPRLVPPVLAGGLGAALGCSALALLSEAGPPAAQGWLRATLGLAPLPLPGWPGAAGLAAGGAGLGLLAGLLARRA